MNIKKFMRMLLTKNKILILGSSGLIGNTVSKYLHKMNCDIALGISKKTNDDNINILKKISNVVILDPLNYSEFTSKLNTIKPDTIINCIGITKHVIEKYEDAEIFFLNSIFPNLLSLWCSRNKKRLIHISTDCIFDGTLPGSRTIEKDIYGYSKFLGEKNLNNGIIIRTSTIGHELNSNYGLLEWFLSQGSTVNGFRKAFFNGVTTLTLSKYIYNIVNKTKNNKIVINLTSNKISKYDLLLIINNLYKCNKNIIPLDNPIIDRSLLYYPKEKLVHIKKSWANQIFETKIFTSL